MPDPLVIGLIAFAAIVLFIYVPYIIRGNREDKQYAAQQDAQRTRRGEAVEYISMYKYASVAPDNLEQRWNDVLLALSLQCKEWRPIEADKHYRLEFVTEDEVCTAELYAPESFNPADANNGRALATLVMTGSKDRVIAFAALMKFMLDNGAYFRRISNIR